MQMRGAPGRKRSSAANAVAAPLPKFTVASTSGIVPAVSIQSSWPSEVNNGTSIPRATSPSRRCAR